jgi:thioredoxin 1
MGAQIYCHDLGASALPRGAVSCIMGRESVLEAGGGEEVSIEDRLEAVSDASFERDVLQRERLAAVVFHAGWSANSELMEPTFERLVESYGDRIDFRRLDVDREAQTPTSYSISTVPCLLLFARGRLVGRLEGAAPREIFVEIVEDALALSKSTSA